MESKTREPSQAPGDEAPAEVEAALAPGASTEALLAEAHRRFGNAAVARMLARGGATALSGPGGELPLRGPLEERFGVDLSDVRAHTDPASQAQVRATGAEGLARGNDVAFAESSPSLHTAAHEVAHVLQQRGGGNDGTAALEGQADRVADRVVAGEGVAGAALGTSGPQVMGKGLAAQVRAAMDEWKLGDEGEGWIRDDDEGMRASVSADDGELRYELAPAPTSEEILATRAKAVDDAFDAFDTTLGKLEQANKRLARANLMLEELPASADDDTLVALKRTALAGIVADAEKQVAALHADAVARHGRLQQCMALVESGEFRDPETLPRRNRIALAADRLTLVSEASAAEMDGSTKPIVKFESKVGKGATWTIGVSRGKQTEETRPADPLDPLSESETREHEHERGASASAGVILDDSTTGARGGIKGAGSWSGPESEGAVEGGLDGTYKVKVVRIPATAPPMFEVQLTVTLGAELGASTTAGRKGKPRAGASGSASASAALSHRRVLTSAELVGYAEALDRAEAGQAPGIDAFELDALRGQIAADNADELIDSAGVALGDADMAARLAPGEAVSLEVDLGLEVGVEGAAGRRAGASLAVGGSLTRVVSVERLAGARGVDGAPDSQPVRVTIGFSDTAHVAAGASAGGVGAEGKLTRGNGRELRFELDASDADYGRVFGELTRATSSTELAEIAAHPENAAYLTRSERSRQEALETGVSFMRGKTGLRVGGTSDFSESRAYTYEDDKATGVEGAYEGGSGEGAGFEVMGVTIADAYQRDHARAEYGADGVSLRIGEDTSERSLVAPWNQDTTVRDAFAAKSPLEALLLQKRENQHGVDLSPAELTKLVQRAGDARAWSEAVYPVDPRLAPAWMDLRQEIIKPKVDPELLAIDPAMARDAARGRAIAEFVQHSGARGYDILARVLDGNGRGEIGKRYEWPGELLLSKARYGVVVEKFAREGAQGPSAAAIARELEDIQFEVEGAEFESPRVKVALLEDILTMLAALGATRSDPTQRIDVIVAVLTQLKGEETRRITRARVEASAFFSDRSEVYADAIGDLEELDALWHPRILELRELCVTHDVECPVSKGPNQPRSFALEPDLGARERIYEARSHVGAITARYDYERDRKRREFRWDNY